MRTILQRSKYSNVKVDGKIVGEIDYGLVILVSFTNTDNIDTINKMIKKILNLRIFDDEFGVMNKSILDVKGSILSISQFTLYADTHKGNRPSYINALNGKEAIKLYDKFNELLKEQVNLATGIFGEEMEVNITNDGPITIALEF